MLEASYGDVTSEYDRAREGAGRLDGLFAAVTVTGPDAVEFLDSLLSQEIASLSPGGVVRSLLLEPRGKLRAILWVGRLPESVVLVTESSAAGTVVEDLSRFLLRTDAAIHAPAPVTAVLGLQASDALRQIGVPAGDGIGPLEGGFVMRGDAGAVPRFFVSGADVTTVDPIGRVAWDAVRIEQGEPEMHTDVDHKTIPQESGLVSQTVSFDKGCFLGQELVARIDSRGHVNRHLRALVIATNVIPPPGAVVESAGEEVGGLTSVSESLQVGAPVALGMVRREVTPGSEVDIVWPGGRVAASVAELPLV
jgi:folate-binding protein YgfZ